MAAVPSYTLGYLQYVETPSFPRTAIGKKLPALVPIFEDSRERIVNNLLSFLDIDDVLEGIPRVGEPESAELCWDNGFITGLDGVALCGFLATRNPSHFIEIGSGSSTKFARRTIERRSLRTRITSIDPTPRADIDKICDEVVRKPLREVDLSIFDCLGPGDILFTDGSHICMPGSDVAIEFLEILPRLATGVLVHIHDIFLPYEYDLEFAQRWYNEQYMLATLLLSGQMYKIEVPNHYINTESKLLDLTRPLWTRKGLKGIVPDAWATGLEYAGLSFWMSKS